MGLDIASGLLGGMQGIATATNTIAEDKLKQLAEKLKMEALEEISARADQRKFGHDQQLQVERMTGEKELQTSKNDFEAGMEKARNDTLKEISRAEIKSKEGIEGAKITSEEKIAGQKDSTLLYIAGMETRTKEMLANTDKKSTEAANLRSKVAAFTEARKTLEANPNDIDGANAILQTAGIPTAYQDVVVDPGKKGSWFFGVGEKAPVTERRMVGGDGRPISGGAQPTEPTGLKSEIARMIEASKGDQPSVQRGADKTSNTGLLQSPAVKEQVKPEVKTPYEPTTPGWFERNLQNDKPAESLKETLKKTSGWLDRNVKAETKMPGNLLEAIQAATGEKDEAVLSKIAKQIKFKYGNVSDKQLIGMIQQGKIFKKE
jgi:hypothetical protein